MLKIVFDTFNISPGNITFHAKTYDDGNLIKDDEIYFKFSREMEVNDNLIAISLSTFCAQKYDEIYMDLAIHEDTISNISSFTRAKVTSKIIDNNEFIVGNKNNMALNFSGGFDSLAEKFLLGDLAELVSIAFFSSETNFFKKFSPHILETNFRQLGYNANTWTFMGVASVLFSNSLNIKYHTFGTVFESYYLQASRNFSLRDVFYSIPFNYADIQDVKLIHAITEIGTALIVCRAYPYLVNDSLASLSVPGTEKRYRKQLIIQALQKKFDLNVYLELTEPPVEERRLIWGENYVVDFLGLYILKYMGIDETSYILRNIPNEAIDFVNNNSLEFYEKFNPDYLNNIPKQFKSEIVKNLSIVEIYPYNQKDYDDLNSVLKFLSKYHPELNEIL